MGFLGPIGDDGSEFAPVGLLGNSCLAPPNVAR
jgi:hypothetical protein